MSTCRYAPGVDCYGAGTVEIASCDARCMGPVDLTKDVKRGGKYPAREALTPTTKPAAPETREEVKTMPSPAPSPTGTCPKPTCGRTDVKLVANKFDPAYSRTCQRCYNTAWAANKAALTGAANTKRAATKAAKKVVAKAHVAAKAKAPAPSKPKMKTSTPAPPQPPPVLTRADLAGAPTRSPARLVFSLPIPAGTTALELMDLLRSVPSTAVVEG